MIEDPFSSAEGLGDRRSLPTRYSGVDFRSRLEARWAVLMDLKGMTWQYEPERFILPPGQGTYLPDFRVTGPVTGGFHWFEVKGERPIDPAELAKIEAFRATFGYDLTILGDIPDVPGPHRIALRWDFDSGAVASPPSSVTRN